MLKKILIALAAIVAIFLIVVALQPSEFKVEPSSIRTPRWHSKARRQEPARS